MAEVSLKKKFLIVLVLFFLSILLFFFFYNNEVITGRAINSINLNNSIKIKTSLSVPEITLDDEYKEISLYLNKGSSINLDNKQIILQETENYIVLKNFKGKIKLNTNTIEEINGKIFEITINNLPIKLKAGSKIKIVLPQDSKYSLFKIKDDVYLKNMFFTTSGNIFVGGDSLSLNYDKLELKNYQGSLTIKDKTLILDGLVEILNIEGSSRKVILSK